MSAIKERPAVFTSAIDEETGYVSPLDKFKSLIQVPPKDQSDYVEKRNENSDSDKLVIFTKNEDKTEDQKSLEALKFEEFANINEQQFENQQKETDTLAKESKKSVKNNVQKEE